MNQRFVVVNAVLWAAAIVAAAAVHAPAILSLILLPALASMALLSALPRRTTAMIGRRMPPTGGGSPRC